VTAEWLAAKCDAMCLKVRVLQNQMIRDTYTPEATEALKRVKYVTLLVFCQERQEHCRTSAVVFE